MEDNELITREQAMAFSKQAAKIKYYSSKQLSIWLSTFRKDWSEELPRAYLAKLLEDNPIIKKVRNTVLNFRRLMKEKEGDKLAAWCHEVINDENENIKGFARGILKDFQAVYQSFISNKFHLIKDFVKL